MIDLWEIENGLYNEDIQVLCGVDEAGRGPLAGLCARPPWCCPGGW